MGTKMNEQVMELAQLMALNYHVVDQIAFIKWNVQYQKSWLGYIKECPT